MTQIDNDPCVPGRKKGHLPNPNCHFLMSSGLFVVCVSVLFCFCQVREVLEMKFYILDVLLISVLSKCVEPPTGIPSSPLSRTQCFVISWEWVFSAPLQLVDLPQLLWSRKATLILSKVGFTRSYSFTDFPYPLTPMCS